MNKKENKTELSQEEQSLLAKMARRAKRLPKLASYLPPLTIGA
jgi:hypothetical protein